jgi:hypothetical protein
MLDNYQRALEDLHKADVLERNNATTLKIREDVKNMLNDY